MLALILLLIIHSQSMWGGAAQLILQVFGATFIVVGVFLLAFCAEKKFQYEEVAEFFPRTELFPQIHPVFEIFESRKPLKDSQVISQINTHMNGG